MGKKLKIAKKAALLTAAVASAATGRAGRRVAIELAKKQIKFKRKSLDFILQTFYFITHYTILSHQLF